MKTKLRFLVLALGVVAFSACDSDKDLYDPDKAAELKATQYTVAFEKQYGKVAADQDWGFGTVISRGANPNSNQWKDFVIVPPSITAEEKSAVEEWFATHKDPTSLRVNWVDFFVQYVGRKNDKVTMNELFAVREDNSEDHMNNFNANGGYIMLMQNSGTSKFGYKTSVYGGGKYYKHAVQYINGSYYVGLDLEAHGPNPNEQVEGDGYYNDWIIKISPAVYKNTQRVIAEDLGAIGDFDFNDVIFDVAKTNDNTTLITLQAAGGTLPLYIKVGGIQKEVHELFGVPTTTMVNTGWETKAPVMLRVNGQYDASQVEVLVQDAAVTYKLKGDCGKAPQKICVPATYEWTSEREAIDSKYPKFADWVGNTAIDWIN